jgi:predicted nucleic acid-binding protein
MLPPKQTPTSDADAQALTAQLTLVTHDHVFQRVKQAKIGDWTR